MPEFSPGEQKVAIVPMTNPTVKAFDYEGTIYMGINLAVVSQVSFHLNAGEQKSISFPITMPTVVGTYPIHIGVSSGEQNIGLYRSTEDVVIAGVAEFAYVSSIRQTYYETYPGQPYSMHMVKLEIDVKNIGSVAGVCNAKPQMACAEGGWTWVDATGYHISIPPVLQATIQPGVTVTFWGTVLNSPYHAGYTCKVRFTGDPGDTSGVPM